MASMEVAWRADALVLVAELTATRLVAERANWARRSLLSLFLAAWSWGRVVSRRVASERRQHSNRGMNGGWQMNGDWRVADESKVQDCCFVQMKALTYAGVGSLLG